MEMGMNVVHRVLNRILNWLEERIEDSGQAGFVVGVSGGIDSAVVSTLCAKTGYPVICLSMPIDKKIKRSEEHMEWLEKTYSNVKGVTVDLTDTFDAFNRCLPDDASEELALVNSRSRLRMMTLYAYAGSHQLLVAGTGNRVEDYGIGFFTKYGDGGVDISPIGDLMKTEVYELARYLEILESIRAAKPSDDLWDDNRSDEDQIGATYKELQWAMGYCDNLGIQKLLDYQEKTGLLLPVSEREEKILTIYLQRHEGNRHKMKMPPICQLRELIK